MQKQLVKTRGLVIPADDVYAVWKSQDEGGSRAGGEDATFQSTGAPGPAVTVFTRLRESGDQKSLVQFALRGEEAADVWDAMARIVGQSGATTFMRFGRWYLRVGRIRAVRLARHQKVLFSTIETPSHVLLSMTDDERDGGWVARVNLDKESGDALEAFQWGQ